MSVQWMRVGDILTLQRRTVPVEVAENYTEIGLRSFGRGVFHKEPVSGADLGNKRVFFIESGDLLLSNVFAWEGAVAVAGSNDSGLIGSHRFMTWTQFDKEQVDVSYLCHYFLSDVGLAQLVGASPGSAGRNKTLGIKAFENLQVPLPDIESQRTIAKDLEHIAAVAHTRNRDTQTIFSALREQILATIADCPTSPLRQLVSPATTAISVEQDKSYPNIGLLNRGRGVFVKPELRGEETKYTRLFPVQTGQLIYSKLFGWEGSVAIVPEQFDGHYVSSEFPHFDVGTEVDLGYLAQAIRSRSFAAQLATATTGMGQRRQRVNIEQFLALSVPVPGFDDQRKVASQLEQLDSAAILIEQQRTVCDALPKAARNEIFAELTR
ncbi:hypothetical protein [Rhodococcus sp. NPDC057529]|uniref:hypothetical protein n=1 Tax=Rhodococcus sp. NPDC057529 TaxID=3346158 RepID=UPI00366EC8D9